MYTGYRKHLCALALAALLLPCLSTAQEMGKPAEKWSLEKCISYAREHNLQIRQMQQDIEIARNNVTGSKMEYLPSVNASMGHNMSWGRSVNLNDLEIVENKLSQSSSMNLSASVPLFEGMRKLNTLKSSFKQLEIANVNIEALEDEISISIARGYLQVLLNMEMEKSADANFNSLQAQVRKTEDLVNSGSQPYSALLEMKSQLANGNVQLATARNNTSTALLELAQMLNLPDSASFEIEVPQEADSDTASLAATLQETVEAASNHPNIRKAELALEQSRLQHKIQKGAALPTLSLSAGYGTYYSDSQNSAFFTQFNNNRNPSVGLSLSIPIFNNWRNSISIRNAKANVVKSEIGVDMAGQQLEKQIRLAYNEAQGSYEKLKAAQANKEAAKESFSQTEEKFNLGMVGATDYSVAKANLLKAESEYIQCKYQYIFQQKILDHYRNLPLTL
jgi:outer membrane protein